MKYDKNKDGLRFYFYGQVQHNQYEKQKLAEFDEYLAKEKLKLPDNPHFTPQKILLILSGHGYKNDKTYNSIVEHDKWRKATLPIQLTTKVEEILVSHC